jgi:AcrR family transcriptional regulator
MLVACNVKGFGHTTPTGNAMGRRSTHTPQQLRELILDAAQDIIQDQGLAGLSAREVARRIEYSPGTIYNMFENLDDVVLHVEARVLDALDRRLSSVLTDSGDPTDRIGRLAQAYLAFTHEKPRLWNLLFEHHMPADAQLPAWYQQKLEGLMGRVEEAMAPLFPPGREADRQRASRVLWAGVHGITSLSTADKLSVVTTETASRLVADLVATYLAGLAPGGSAPEDKAA